ncbi:MAG TPA: ubiquitin-like domain-containing protein [Bacillota bacterium]|nr:ubiquitin-like domain-containing protein [Bacillota bacterium]
MNVTSKANLTSKKKLIISCIGGLALIVFAAIVFLEVTKATVVFAQDGEEQTVRTHSNTVEELLSELDVDVGEHDHLSADLGDSIEDGMNIEYKEAKTIHVTIDEDEETFHTTAFTLDEFLEEESIEVTDHDEVSQDLDQEIEHGLELDIVKAFEVTIADGKEDEEKVWTTGSSVESLLADHDVELNKDDKVKPALDKDIEEETTVAITRVEKKKDVVEESVAFSVDKKEDNSLEKGKEKVVTDGKEGLVEKEYEIIYENGKEVDRKVLNETVKKESKNKVVAVGTKEAPSNLQTLGSSSNKGSSSSSSSSSKPSGGKEMVMQASAYTADCSGCSGYTATGINLKANPNMKVIAVDPSVIPLGSRVWVEGYGEAVAGDTGGAIKGNRIDVHVPNRQAALSFGRKQVRVKVLN